MTSESAGSTHHGGARKEARGGSVRRELWKRVSPASVDLEQRGRTGLQISFLGAVDEELHTRLSAGKDVRIFRQMADNDPTINAFMLAVDGTVRRVPWRVRPARAAKRPTSTPTTVSAASKRAEREAAYLETVMHDMSTSWRDTLSSTLSMLTFGYAALEIVYKLRLGPEQASSRYRSRYADGRVGWRMLAPRAAETVVSWEFDDEGGVEAMKQRVDYVDYVIPIEKLLLFRLRAIKGGPVGKSLLRGVYRPWFMRTRLEEIEAVGAERDLVGYPVMEVPIQLLSDSASSEDQALAKKLWKLLMQTRRNQREGALIPSKWNPDGQTRSGFDLYLLRGETSRAIDIDTAIKRHRTDMAMAFLFGFMLLGLDARGGGRALGGPLLRFFLNSIEYIADVQEDVINQYAVPRLMRLDGVPPEVWPRVEHGSIERLSARDAADVVRLLGTVAGGDLLERAAAAVVEQADLAVERPERQSAQRPAREPARQGPSPPNDAAPSRRPETQDPLREGEERAR